MATYPPMSLFVHLNVVGEFSIFYFIYKLCWFLQCGIHPTSTILFYILYMKFSIELFVVWWKAFWICIINMTTIYFMFTEARAEISGPNEKYLKPGSLLRLTCRIYENIENPLYIFWYHNNRMINFDTHLGVNVSTESGNFSHLKTLWQWKSNSYCSTDNKYSELQISQTSPSNSGNYTCVTNNAVPSSTFVHILLYGECQFALFLMVTDER